MLYYVYILYSEESDSFYIGQTQDIPHRIHEHNTHIYKGSETRKAGDWKLYYSIECESRTQAIMIEKHIKRMKSRKYIENLARYPEISKLLQLKYS
ncbi:GIY-YIG nuclease family protein [Saccharicrinis sp. FJH54]|uniref:GIY-YIG nuclease family protein n=1 Tax=Saccharicrinis sp. FJH54 TaxID=3344665 RepID=UPI0035D443CA